MGAQATPSPMPSWIPCRGRSAPFCGWTSRPYGRRWPGTSGRGRVSPMGASPSSGPSSTWPGRRPSPQRPGTLVVPGQGLGGLPAPGLRGSLPFRLGRQGHTEVSQGNPALRPPCTPPAPLGMHQEAHDQDHQENLYQGEARLAPHLSRGSALGVPLRIFEGNPPASRRGGFCGHL